MTSGKQQKDLSKVAMGTAMALAGSIAGRGIAFVSQGLIAGLLGAEIFGLFVLGVAVVSICSLLARLGLQNGGMKFVSVYFGENAPRLKGTIITSLSFSLLAGSLAGALLYALSGVVAQAVFHKPGLSGVLRLLSVVVPFLTGASVLSSMLQGLHTTKYSVYSRDIVQPAVNAVFILVFYFSGLGLYGVIFALALSHFASLASALYFFGRQVPEFFDRTVRPEYETKKLLSYSLPIIFIGFVNYGLSWTDTLMLGALGTLKDVGIYRLTAQLPILMTLFLTATNAIYSPLAADLSSRGEMGRLGALYKTTTRWVTYASVPVFICLMVGAEEVLAIFGRDFSEGAAVLKVLAVGSLINCITGGAGITLIMAGKQKVQLYNGLSTVLLNVLLNVLLIPRYGILGAAFSTAFSTGLTNAVKVFLVHRLFGIHPFSRRSALFITAGLAAVAILTTANMLLGIPANNGLFAKALEIGIVIGLLFPLSGYDPEDRYLFESVRKKFS